MTASLLITKRSEKHLVTAVAGTLHCYGGSWIPPRDSSSSRKMETDLGLVRGSLKDGFRTTRVDGISDRSPRSPLEGNKFFLGPGKGLPGGAPEMVINSIPTR